MKLRNKKTGEIGELHFESDKEYHFTVVMEDPADLMIFKTLAELNEEWEDYEEPKEYWYINNYDRIENEKGADDAWFVIRLKQIGNYFETKEEAEKAVEKLKAWKRLKDKGFKFNGYEYMMAPGHRQRVYIDWFIPNDYEKYIPDLDLLFGGEE